MRTLAASLGLVVVLALPAGAQRFGGTWVMQAPTGPITLTLTQAAGGRTTGTLTIEGDVIQLGGTIAQGRLSGQASLGARRGVFEAAVEGDQLALVIAETNAAGVPDPATAQQLLFQRGAAGAAPATPAAPGAGAGAPPPARGGGTAADRELTQLLLSSAWCSFSYSQTSGRTSTSRNVFLTDGRLLIGTNTEGGTVNQYGGTATPNGSVYSQSQGGQTARWQVQGGRLFVDLGAGPQPVALSVARNSNGYPIITADGTEYSQCR